MKQSNSVARQGLCEPSASPEPVGRGAARELHLATPQTAPRPKASQGNGRGLRSPRCAWAPHRATFSVWSLVLSMWLWITHHLLNAICLLGSKARVYWYIGTSQ